MKAILILFALITMKLTSETHIHYHFSNTNAHRKAIVGGHHAGWWCELKCKRHFGAKNAPKKAECVRQCKLADNPNTVDALKKKMLKCQKSCSWKFFWSSTRKTNCKKTCHVDFQKAVVALEKN